MAVTRSVVAVPDNPPTQHRITTAIVAMLDIRGMSHAELAQLAGIDATKLSKSIKGTRRLTLDECERIAAALHTPLPRLFDGGDAIRRKALEAVLGADYEGPDSGPGLGVRPTGWTGDVVSFGARRVARPRRVARSGHLAA